jgi:hypothetical protein
LEPQRRLSPEEIGTTNILQPMINTKAINRITFIMAGGLGRTSGNVVVMSATAGPATINSDMAVKVIMTVPR